MSSSPVRTVVLAAVLLLPTAAHAEPPTSGQIAQWVKELGDGNFNVREEAGKRLWEAGEAAEAAVRAAARSDDPEVARRAGELAEKFRWGIYPNTPPKVIELVGRYQAADDNGKLAVVRELFGAGAVGCATLLKVARAEPDDNFRRRLLGQIGHEAPRAVPALLVDGSFANLEALLDLAVGADADLAMPNYAAYWLLRGGLDAAIARRTAEAARPDGRRAAEVLVYLYRAKGDLAAARVAAEKTGRADLLDEVLYQQGDWKALAQRPAANDVRRTAEALGYQAAYQRLAGDRAALDRTLADLRKHAAGLPDNDVEVWYTVKALFLNDRPEDALDVLVRSARRADVRFEVLAAQGRYREAFAAADALKDDSPMKLVVEVLRARTLYTLGEKERAQAVFTKLADRIRTGPPALWQERLIAAEARLGLHEQAQKHCAWAVAAAHKASAVGLTLDARRLFGAAFPGRGDEAAALWECLRRAPKALADPEEAMKQLRHFLDGHTTEQEITALASAGEQQSREQSPEEREEMLLALAKAASAARCEALAAGYLEKAAAEGSVAALLRLGDGRAAKNEWSAAAEYYARAWAGGAQDPLPLFLRGDALARAGRAKDGALWTERARLLPLGDEPVRLAFADALAERGFAEEARRERDLLVRVSQPGSYYAGDALRQSALEAAARRDDLKAADLHERSLLRCLDGRISFQEGAAYVAVPHAVHRHRALGLLAAGRLDEARKEIALCEAALPADVDLPCRAVPALEKAGSKGEADALFRRSLDRHEQLCRDYPNSAREHNTLAWLCACCRRDLDKGLEHARRSVALAPDAAGYHDTLAEVYFQHGDREQALAAARRSAELEPKSAYYQRQLKRIEAGDPKADLPSP